MKTLKNIAISTLLVLNTAILTMPTPSLAAPVKVPVAKKIATSKLAPLPPATIFLPNGSMFRPNAKSATTPVVVVPMIPAEKKYADTIINNKDIVLSGTDVMEIKNTHYIQNGSITVKDKARLVIVNSLFEQRTVNGVAPRLDASNYGQVIVKNSKANFSPWIVWHFADNAELSINDMNVSGAPGDANIYYEITGSTVANIIKTPFIASLTDKVDLTVDRSTYVSLTLNLAGGAIVDEAFPKVISEYNFPGFDDRNVSQKIKITNSYAPEWGITLYPTSNVTIQNTEGLTIAFSIISPWKGATATFDNLHSGLYKDEKFGFSQTTNQIWDLNMKLRLVKTNVKSWAPMVGDDNTLIIKNSQIAELPWSWGNSKIILENSTVGFIRARQSVEITAKDSTITGDITAIEDGKINLVRTRVAGQKIIKGKGQIVE